MTDTPETPASDRRMQELVSYLTAKSDGDPQFSATKLNWLLFYCDFTAYRRLGRSITGYMYQKLPSGPDPKVVQIGFGSSPLSSDEAFLVDELFDDFRTMRCSELSFQRDGFVGWQVADFGEVIPYETVFLGDPSMPLTQDEIEFCLQSERERQESRLQEG